MERLHFHYLAPHSNTIESPAIPPHSTSLLPYKRVFDWNLLTRHFFGFNSETNQSLQIVGLIPSSNSLVITLYYFKRFNQMKNPDGDQKERNTSVQMFSNSRDLMKDYLFKY